MADLPEAIASAVNGWLLENGGGFPIAYVIALDYVNSDGENTIYVNAMDDQPVYRSMGLASYLDAWYRDDAQMTWQRELWSSAEREDDDL